MQLIDQKVWDEWRSNQGGDEYGLACFDYAERWANLMEAQISSGEELESIASQTSHDADVDGITGFMYGMAVSVLSQCWAHGERLRRWHNLATQLGDEGEGANENGGVLNPALLSIS